MEEEKELLTVDELAGQGHDFKTRWYGFVKKVEGLTNFKSGFDEGFKTAIGGLYDDIDTCKEYIDRFEYQLKHYFPDERSDITWLTKKVFRHLEDLRVMVKRDNDVLEGSKGLAENLKTLTADVEKTETKLKAAEKKSGDACGKYFDMKNDYTRELQGIEERIKKRLIKVREKFIEMTTPIVEGHEITLASKKMGISELFEQLAEKPADTEKINLVMKKGGIFGKKAETDLAKTSVLKYVSTEILEDVSPVNKEKKQLMSKLEADYTELPKLERACEDAERQRKKLEKPVEERKEKMSQIKKSEVFKFSDYDGILETREQYLDKIKEAEKEVKEYLDFALLHLKGFVELETDVEKRNLLTEVKTMKEKVASMEKEVTKAREDLSSKIAELTTITATKESLEKRFDAATESLKTAEKEGTELKNKVEALNKTALEFEKHILSNLRKFESEVKSKLSSITSSIEPKKKKAKAEKAVGNKVDTLRGKSKK
jgi:chromosome segregation ATPase